MDFSPRNPTWSFFHVCGRMPMAQNLKGQTVGWELGSFFIQARLTHTPLWWNTISSVFILSPLHSPWGQFCNHTSYVRTAVFNGSVFLLKAGHCISHKSFHHLEQWPVTASFYCLSFGRFQFSLCLNLTKLQDWSLGIFFNQEVTKSLLRIISVPPALPSHNDGYTHVITFTYLSCNLVFKLFISNICEVFFLKSLQISLSKHYHI